MDTSEIAGSGSEPDVPVAKPCDDDGDSLSESPELTCIRCKITSKADCPIITRKRVWAATADEAGEASAKTKLPMVRVAWGKTTSRKTKTKSGRKINVVRICGQWCRVCMDISKKTS